MLLELIDQFVLTRQRMWNQSMEIIKKLGYKRAQVTRWMLNLDSRSRWSHHSLIWLDKKSDFGYFKDNGQRLLFHERSLICPSHLKWRVYPQSSVEQNVIKQCTKQRAFSWLRKQKPSNSWKYKITEWFSVQNSVIHARRMLRDVRKA